MNLSIIGTGYVGLVTGVCLAELGHNINLIDNDTDKINHLKAGKIDIYEPNLADLLIKNSNRINFYTSLDKGITSNTDAIFIAVGTPEDKTHGGADLSYVYKVAEQLADTVKDGITIITKSSVPVGTGKKIREIISAKQPKLNFTIASNPEFLREGTAICDFLQADRVVIGIDNQAAKPTMQAIYQPLADKDIPIIFTDIVTAELAKYSANSYLATRLSFVNEIADICERTGANIKDLAHAVGLDKRIGTYYFRPGPGIGGSCFPKDTKALRKIAHDYGAGSSILNSVINFNIERKNKLIHRIVKFMDGSVDGKTIAIMGLAFKANTDDVRESPAINIIHGLLEHNANINTYDPEGTDNMQQLFSDANINWCDDAYNALKNADLAIFVTEWGEFRTLDFSKVKELMAASNIMDFRIILDKQNLTNLGFNVYTLGEGAVQVTVSDL